MNQKLFLLFITSFIFLILTTPLVYSSFLINEIMYDPDDHNEWIELYNPTSTPINLSGWQFTDNKNTDAIICCSFDSSCTLTIPAQSYALLTDQDTTLYNTLATSATKLCVDDKSLGNGLDNTQDTLTLHNSTFSTSVNYTTALGGHNNNKSLERKDDNTFGESLIEFGTPGKANSVTNPQLQYKNLLLSEILANPFGEDNLPKPLGEWIELYNQGPLSLDLQKLIIKNNANQTLIISSTTLFNDQNTVICPGCYKVIYRNALSSFSLSDEYGQISLYKDQTLLSSVSYSNALENISFSYNIDPKSWEYTLPTPNQPNLFSNLCDLSLEIRLNQGSFVGEGEQNFTVIAKTIGNIPQKISVHGVIRNAAEDILREYAPWNNQLIKTNLTKTYTPTLYPGIHSIEFSTINQSCIDINQNNNNVTEFLGVESMEFFDPYSTLYIDEIKSFQPNKTRWGDHLDVSFFIYKGDETKNSGKIWAEKDGKTISESTTFLLPVNHQVYLMTLPLILHPNCDHKLTDGQITVFLEAVNLTDNRTLFIENISEKSCQTIEKIVEKEIKISVPKKSASSKTSTSKKATSTKSSSSSTKKATNTTKTIKSTIPKIAKNTTKPITTKQEVSTFFYTTPLPNNLSPSPSSLKFPVSPGIIVYESNSAKTTHLIPYLLLISFLALCIITLKRA